MADTLNTISVISFVAAGVFAALAAALWFLFKIPAVIGDLSGRTARKSIERMRQNNERTGSKSYKTSEKNRLRGKLTSTMEGMGGMPNGENGETGLLKENLAGEYAGQETGLLTDAEAGRKAEDTVPLDGVEEKIARKAPSVSVRLLEEVMLIHTEETI